MKKIFKMIFKVLKYSVLIVIGIVLLCLMSIGALFWGLMLFDTISCEPFSVDVSYYTEMDYCFQVDADALDQIRNTGLYDISGISRRDMVYSSESERVLVHRNSNLRNALRRLEFQAFYVGDAEADTKYIEGIDTIFDATPLPFPESEVGEWIQCRIYLNGERSFWCAFEIAVVEGTERYKGDYVIRPLGKSRFYRLKNADGFYAWLDENVFNDAEKTEK